MSEISRLHHITQDNIKGFSHSQLAEEACRGGAGWIQLRMKGAKATDWQQHAEETLVVCRKYGAKLIINDNPELVLKINADGVHLGKTDMDPVEARKMLGEKYIIGGTANNFEDIQRLAEAGVDYIGLGPFRFTKTKENLSPVLGTEGFKTIMDQCRENDIHIPVIAIGGILPEDVPEILNTGVYGVAVASAINMEADKSKAAARYIQVIENEKAALS